MRRCLACGTGFDGASAACPQCHHQPQSIGGFPVYAPQFAGASEGFRPEFFVELASLEGTNFWFQARSDLIVWACRRFFPLLSRFLEIGCGTGHVLSRVADAFPAAEVMGSEILAAGLPYARPRVPRADLFQMDARRIPYVDHFDVIGAFDVLEHIAEDELVLREIHQALRPGGGVMLTVPQHV